jgi:hypothetical protein
MRAFPIIGFIVGFGCGAFALQLTHKNRPQQIADQVATCEMKAYDVFKTSDKDNSVLPGYVSDCMMAVGRTFSPLNTQCQKDFDDAISAADIGKLGGFSTPQDPACYE